MSSEDDGFNSKNWVWIPDSESNFFSKGYITDYLQDGTCKVTVVNGNKETHQVVPQNTLENCNPAKFNKCHDMAELTHLNEPSVVYNLYLRYNDDMIYTYSGLFLVAINPYKSLKIYDTKTLKKYHNHEFDKPPPHIFATAEGTFRNMLSNRKDQSILVTGESGAGKTENTKKIIQYLSSITSSAAAIQEDLSSSVSSTASIPTNSRNIDTKILQANPILESFGNAKTIKNNNSSRFGKFIRIFFSSKGAINGANIDYYLLEKSRVVSQSSQERNYHIFYQFLKGSDKLSQFGLSKDIGHHKYLSNSTTDIPNVDDFKEFNLLVEAFTIMGFSTQEVNNIFLLLGVVLHLGNLDFSSWKSEQASFTSDSPVDIIVKLLGINKSDFVNNLLKPKVKAGREFVQKSKKAPEVKYAIDALAKHIYEKIFQYIIERINESLKIEGSYDEEQLNFIGVLDIAGFEIFEKNSFEQLCINFTNEKLQQFFNHHSFILEQSEYLREDIQWEFIDFGQDLQPTIDLIEQRNPMGVLKILDEECVIPKSSDKSFMEKLASNWGKGKSPKFEENKYKSGFIIHHYAGKVEYNVDNWLQKNTDPVNEHVLKLLPGSSNEFVGKMFENDEHLAAETKRGTMKLKTASQKHKEQLGNLMDQLGRTEPHFVRCILPNLEKKANKFDKTLVLNQLRCNGVLEGIRITRAGYPNRMTFEEFNLRYAIINVKGVYTKNLKTNSELILKFVQLDSESFKIGITKIFFKNGILGKLEEMRDLCLKGIFTDLQSVIRGMTARKSMEKKIKEIQSSQLIARTIKQVNDSLASSLWLDLFVNIKPLLEESVKVLDSKEVNENLKNVSVKLKDAEKSKVGLENDNSKLREQIQKLEEEVTSTSQLILERDATLKQLKEEETMSESKIKDLETNLAKIESSHKEALQEKDVSTAKSKEISERLNRKVSEFVRLQDEHNNVLTRLSDLEVLINEHKKEKKKHKDVIAGLKREHESSKELIQSEIDKLQSLNSQLELEKSELEKNNAELSPKNRELSEEIESLKVAISTHVSKVASSDKELTSLNTRTKKLEEENRRLQSQLLEAELKAKKVLMEMDKKSIEIQKEKDGYQTLLGEIEILRSKSNSIALLNKELTQQKSESISLSSRIEALEKQLAEATTEKKSVAGELQKLKVDFDGVHRAKAEYSNTIVSLNDKIRALEEESRHREEQKENYPPDPAFVEEFANIKLKLNEQSAALRKEKFENRKLSEELTILKERIISGKAKGDVNRRSVAMGESINLNGGLDILTEEIEKLKQKLQQEAANSQRAELYAIELQKKLNKLQSTRGLNTSTDFEKLYKQSQSRLADLEYRCEQLLVADVGTPKPLVKSESFGRSTLISNTLASANQDFVLIYQDITKTLRSTREELTTSKSEILRLKSLLRDSEEELYDAKKHAFRSTISNYEEELAHLKVRHDTLNSKNGDLMQSVELYRKRAEEYYKKLELAESAVKISKRHEQAATKELEEVKSQLRLIREEARTSQIIITDIRKKNTSLEETILDKVFEIKQLSTQIRDLKDKLDYSNKSANREANDRFKEEIRVLHQELNFKMEKETELVRENKKFQLDLEELTAEKNDIVAAHDDSLIQIDKLEGQVSELNNKLRVLENSKVLNERKINTLTRQLDHTKELVSELTLQRDTLLEKRDELEGTVSELTNKLDDVLSQLEQSKVDVTLLKQHLDNKNEESETIKSELNQSKLSTTTDEQDFQRIRKQMLVASEENDSLKKVNSELTKKVHILEEKLYSNDQLKYWETKVKDMNKELDASHQQNYDDSKTIKSLERNIKELAIRVQNESVLTKKYNDENFDFQNKINKYKSTIDILHHENNEKELVVKEKERENFEIKEHLLGLEKEVLELRERLGLI